MEPSCLFEGRGMTVWEFEHLKFRLSGNAPHAMPESVGNSTQEGAPRLGFDAVKLGHLVGDQVRGSGEGEGK